MAALSIPNCLQRRTLGRTLMGAAAAMALLGACGSGGEEAAGSDDLYNPMGGPLAKLLGYDASTADMRAKELESQQVMVECMKAEGWEYKPVDWSAGSTYDEEWTEQMEDPVAYGEKYGYGVVRSHDMQEEMSGGEMPEDPNMEYVNSLTMDEQEAYYESLYGPSTFSESSEMGVDDTMPAYDPSTMGCSGQAQAEVYGDTMFSNPDLMTRVDEMMQQAAEDPAVKEAEQKWADCMAEKDPSYTWSTPDEIYNYLWDKLNVAQGYGSMSESGDGSFTSETVVGDEMVDEMGTFEMPEVDEAAIEDLRKEELTIWTDDFACQGEAEIAQVRRDVEQQVADDLLAEFPELGDK
jgi:hypothetical protein